ncbi:TPA: hypothetical protein ACVO3A_003767 [Vibrio diabolicus]
MMIKKMNIIAAKEAFELDSLDNVTRSQLKKMYKRAMFKLHPDRGGDKLGTQLLNEAYATLRTIVKPDESIATDSSVLEDQDSGWLYEKNAGHPLHNSGLAATRTRDELVKEAFDIRDDCNAPDICYWHSKDWHPNQQNGIFFKNDQMAMRLDHWLGQRDVMSLIDITDGFLHRKFCGEMRIEVKQFGSGYSDNTRLLSNVLREWLQERGDRESGFHWCDFYKEVRSEIERVFNEGREDGQLFGCKFTIEKVSWLICQAKVEIGDSMIAIGIGNIPSKDVFNPFNLNVVKPLKSAPSRWKVSDLVKVLINGQFHSLKQDYYLTDDYAMDAALGFRTGYIDNPILEALSWHGETRRSCFGLFSNALPNTEAIQVSFGKHSNDSSSFTLDLDNRYPSISLEDDVVQLEEILKIDVA